MLKYFVQSPALPLLPDRCDSVRRHKHLWAKEVFKSLFISIVFLFSRERLNSTLSILRRHLGCISQSPQLQPLQPSSSVFCCGYYTTTSRVVSASTLRWWLFKILPFCMEIAECNKLHARLVSLGFKLS